LIEFAKNKSRPRLTDNEYKLILDYRNKKSSVLVIGDLHAPFIKEGYLEFCQSMQIKYGCSQILFIGDILDNHASGYHEPDADGQSAGDELTRAFEIVQEWYKTFPDAKVCTGNHDAIPARKANTGGLPGAWIKRIDEVLNVPGWDFQEEHEIDDVLYVHGIGRKARTRTKNELVNIVQGHYHSESYIEFYVGLNRKTFCMQVGCGLDRRTYAAAYAKHFPKQHINVGIVIDGKLPILEYMDL
jgi:hypothetical protein